MNTSIYLATDGKELEIIRKGNQLIEAKYDLSLNQQRILSQLLTLVMPYDDDFKDYRIDIAELANKYNLGSTKSIYKNIQNSLKGMVGNALTFTQGDDVVVVSWLAAAKYRNGRGYADVSFHPDLKPLLLFLKSHYTEYPAEAIENFKSSYSFRFYEWLQSFRYKGKGGRFYRVFTIQEIREKMEIDEFKYKYFGDIKRFIIEPALKEINILSDLSIVSVEYLKVGRAIGEVKITAEPKKQITMVIDEKPNQEENEVAIENNKRDQEKERKRIKVLEHLADAGIGLQTGSKWIDKYGVDRIERNLAYVLSMQKNTEIKSLNAYLARAIMDDIADGWEDESEKKQKIIAKKQAEENKKKLEEELQRKIEREEYQQCLTIFNEQEETMQDVILDSIESEITKTGNKYLIQDFTKRRDAGEAHTCPIFYTYFKRSIKYNGFIDIEFLYEKRAVIEP